MARLQAVLLALSLSPVLAEDRNVIPGKWGCSHLETIDACCKALDGRDGMTDHKCVPAKSGTFSTNQMCEPACYVDGSKSCGGILDGVGADEASKMYNCNPTPKPAATTTPEPTTTPTTTLTPWDSSDSSSADLESLDSAYSSSFKDDSDSFASSADSSGETSGSTASGSSGSYMPLWMWGILGALGTMACCAILGAMMKPKKKKKVPKKQPTGPAKTTLASDHPAGCTYLEVVSQAGFKAGDTIEIGAGTAMAEIHDVTGLGSILLSAPLMYPQPQGTPVQVVPKPVVEEPAMPELAPLMPVTTSYVQQPMVTTAQPVMTYAQPMMYQQPMTSYAPTYSGAGYVV
jgi:hypothetical protein